MISRDCDRRKFIEAVEDKDLTEVIRIASGEVVAVENFPLGKKPTLKDGAVEVQKWKNMKGALKGYGNFLGAFLFFMRCRVIKPASISDEDFQLFRPVCENLVKKGQLPAEVMKCFESVE